MNKIFSIFKTQLRISNPKHPPMAFPSPAAFSGHFWGLGHFLLLSPHTTFNPPTYPLAKPALPLKRSRIQSPPPASGADKQHHLPASVPPCPTLVSCFHTAPYSLFSTLARGLLCTPHWWWHSSSQSPPKAAPLTQSEPQVPTTGFKDAGHLTVCISSLAGPAPATVASLHF